MEGLQIEIWTCVIEWIIGEIPDEDFSSKLDMTISKVSPEASKDRLKKLMFRFRQVLKNSTEIYAQLDLNISKIVIKLPISIDVNLPLKNS